MAGYRNTAAFAKAVAGDADHGARPLCGAVRDGAVADLGRRQPVLHRRHRRSGDARHPLARSATRNPAEVSRTIRGWHFGRYPAMRSASARERLTEFVPVLLEALAGGENADAAFAAFDRFLARMPAGVQLFSLLQIQSRPAQPAGDGARRRAAPRRNHRAPRPCDGCAARPGLLRLAAGRRRCCASGWPRRWPRRATSRTCSTAPASSARSSSSSSACACSPIPISVRQAGYAYSDLADALRRRRCSMRRSASSSGRTAG